MDIVLLVRSIRKCMIHVLFEYVRCSPRFTYSEMSFLNVHAVDFTLHTVAMDIIQSGGDQVVHQS